MRIDAACIASFPAAALAPGAAMGQATPAPPPHGTQAAVAAEPDVVVLDRRGVVLTDLQPLATFDAAAIAATSIGELLRVIRGVIRSVDGQDPVFLLNAQRVSGYEEIGNLPPEAIEKVEVLPEPVALRYGYPPTRRVVNFVTKQRRADRRRRRLCGRLRANPRGGPGRARPADRVAARGGAALGGRAVRQRLRHGVPSGRVRHVGRHHRRAHLDAARGHPVAGAAQAIRGRANAGPARRAAGERAAGDAVRLRDRPRHAGDAARRRQPCAVGRAPPRPLAEHDGEPFAATELSVSATYEATRIANGIQTIYALTPAMETALPALFARDASGALATVAFRPTNIFRETRHALNLTLNANGQLGRAKPPATPGGSPPERPGLYGGLGPTNQFQDRVDLRPAAPVLDLLAGDTLSSGTTPRVAGYGYGGLNYLGNGGTFDFCCTGGATVRGTVAASTLAFAPLCKINVSGSLSLHHFLPRQGWTRHLGLKLEVADMTDQRHVRDADGATPYRYQPDLLDPIGRTATLSLRKLF